MLGRNIQGGDEEVTFYKTKTDLAAAGDTTVLSNYFESQGLVSLSLKSEEPGEKNIVDWFDLLVMNQQQETKQIYVKFGSGIQETKYEGKIIATPDGLIYTGKLGGQHPYTLVFINHEVGESLRYINELEARFRMGPETQHAHVWNLFDFFIARAEADGPLDWMGNEVSSEISNMVDLGKLGLESSFMQGCKTCLVSAIKGAIKGITQQFVGIYSLGKGIVSFFKSPPTSFTQKLHTIGTAIGNGLHKLKDDFIVVAGKLGDLDSQTIAKLFCGLIAQLLAPLALDTLIGGSLIGVLLKHVVTAVKELIAEYKIITTGLEDLNLIREDVEPVVENVKTAVAASSTASRVVSVSLQTVKVTAAVAVHVEDAASGVAR